VENLFDVGLLFTWGNGKISQSHVYLYSEIVSIMHILYIMTLPVTIKTFLLTKTRYSFLCIIFSQSQRCYSKERVNNTEAIFTHLLEKVIRFQEKKQNDSVNKGRATQNRVFQLKTLHYWNCWCSSISFFHFINHLPWTIAFVKLISGSSPN